MGSNPARSLTFSSICSVYIDRHIRVDLSDDEQFVRNMPCCNTVCMIYNIWSDELSMINRSNSRPERSGSKCLAIDVRLYSTHSTAGMGHGVLFYTSKLKLTGLPRSGKSQGIL